MNEMDYYYRALLGYRKVTAESDKCSALRSQIAGSSINGDKITVKTASCNIDKDWVDAIEEGLIHIEKCIKMERQFIRSNGEVIPIEKVKRVSKESIEHLAKHSNLISRFEEDEELVPDKLYTVERLNDYTVYENRFLYMLLCYLRDFVTIRYNDILELTNKYDATLDFDKKIGNGRQTMTYTVSMHDVRRDDEYLKEHNPAKETIDRIDLILKTVLAFLATPLMEEVSKAPMLKPPITKTNVLKMNNEFKAAVALYEFIISYDKKGYTAEIRERTLAPFRDELADELAEAGGMLSFLTYEWGLGIKSELKDAYAREEARREAEKVKQRAEQIEALKRRLKKAEITPEEYILTVEKQLRALESESERAEALAKEVERLSGVESQLLSRISGLEEDIVDLKDKMEAERQRHFKEMCDLNAKHENETHQLLMKHRDEIALINETHKNEIIEINERHNAELTSLREKHEQQINSFKQLMAEREEQIRAEAEASRQRMQAQLDGAKEKYEARIGELTAKGNEANESLAATKAAYEKLFEDHKISEARVKALGGLTHDHTDRASFDRLEEEFLAFQKLYKEQWTKTKKAIRKKHINLENIKGQSEKNKKDSE